MNMFWSAMSVAVSNAFALLFFVLSYNAWQKMLRVIGPKNRVATNPHRDADLAELIAYLMCAANLLGTLLTASRETVFLDIVTVFLGVAWLLAAQWIGAKKKAFTE